MITHIRVNFLSFISAAILYDEEQQLTTGSTNDFGLLITFTDPVNCLLSVMRKVMNCLVFREF